METREHKIKRLTMRSMRRGIKEMDLILMHYAQDKLSGMSDDALDHYDALLNENDQDLYQWCSGQVPPAREFTDLIADIKVHIAERF
jgi:antitoxin CptB